MNNKFNLMLILGASIVSSGCEEGTSSTGGSKSSGAIVYINSFEQPENIYNYEDSEYLSDDISNLKGGQDFDRENVQSYISYEKNSNTIVKYECGELIGIFRPDNDPDRVPAKEITQSELSKWNDFKYELITDICCPKGSEYVGWYNYSADNYAAAQCMF